MSASACCQRGTKKHIFSRLLRIPNKNAKGESLGWLLNPERIAQESCGWRVWHGATYVRYS
jgi:hypothetical protein